MTCEIKDFHEENRERIEKNKRELVILKARLANLTVRTKNRKFTSRFT